MFKRSTISSLSNVFTLGVSLGLICSLFAGCQGRLLPSDSDLEDRPERLSLDGSALSVQARRFHKEVLRLRPEAGGYGVLVRHTTWNEPGGGNIQSRERALNEIAKRVRQISVDTLVASDVKQRELLLSAIEREIERLALRLDHWRFDSSTEPHTLAFAVAAELPTRTPLERHEFFKAWKACAQTANERTERLRESATLGLIAPKSVLLRVASELNTILDDAPIRSAFLDVAKGHGTWMEVSPRQNIAALAAEMYGDAREQSRLRRTNLHLQDGEHTARGTRILVPDLDDPMSVEGRGRFVARTLGAIATDLYPAFIRYRDFILEELLPVAPDGSGSHLATSESGRYFYGELLRFHTTLGPELGDPETLHASAQGWLNDVVGELSFLGRRAFGAESWAALRSELDRAQFGVGLSREATIVQAVARAERLLPLNSAPPAVLFTNLDDDRPWSENVVQRDRLGNLRFAYDTPEWALEAAAFRSITPGATWFLDQRQSDPLFLDRLLPTAMVDGWGLHALRLANASRLYDNDWSLLGALAMEANAAAKLVVDTGLHAQGWDREQAREAFERQTLLSDEEIERTIDRILADPGRFGAPAAGRLVFSMNKTVPGNALSTYLSHERPVSLAQIATALSTKPAEMPIEPIEPAPIVEAIEATVGLDEM